MREREGESEMTAFSLALPDFSGFCSSWRGREKELMDRV